MDILRAVDDPYVAWEVDMVSTGPYKPGVPCFIYKATSPGMSISVNAFNPVIFLLFLRYQFLHTILIHSL